MNRVLTPALCALAGIAIGGLAVQGLHAQAKPPVYFVAEITVTNPQAYGKEYAPKAQASIKAAGGKIIALGGTAEPERNRSRDLMALRPNASRYRFGTAWRSSKPGTTQRTIKSLGKSVSNTQNSVATRSRVAHNSATISECVGGRRYWRTS